MMNSYINRLLDKSDLGKLLLRVSFGFLMLLHGWHKVHGGIGGIEKMLYEAGLPTFLGYGVYVGEVIAPIFIILGVFTRISALVLSITMVFAQILAHSAAIFTLTKTGAWGAEGTALYFFAGLSISLLGSGKYAIFKDNRWS